MNKLLKYLWVILKTSVLGGLTIVTTIAVITEFCNFINKYLNNNLFAIIVIGVFLIALIGYVGTIIDEKIKKL